MIRYAKPAIVYILVHLAIGRKAISQFSIDVGQQVKAGVADRSNRPRAQPAQSRTPTSSFALAGRFLFNVVASPLLLGLVLAGLAWITGLIVG
jgi:hypothetical protein